MLISPQFQVAVSPETILAFLQLSEREAIDYVIAYRGHLLEAQLSAETVNARLAALKSFVTYAAKRKLCAFSVPPTMLVASRKVNTSSVRISSRLLLTAIWK